MNPTHQELEEAARRVFAQSSQPEEFRRRQLHLLKNVVEDNHTDDDVRQVIKLAKVPEEGA